MAEGDRMQTGSGTNDDATHRNVKSDRGSSHRGSDPAAMEGTAGNGRAASPDDLESYLVHLAHLDMALPLKIELIRALRSIMQSFVDRAFGDDPVQQVVCLEGKSIEHDDPAAASVVKSGTKPSNSDNLKGAFRQQAKAPARARKKKP